MPNGEGVEGGRLDTMKPSFRVVAAAYESNEGREHKSVRKIGSRRLKLICFVRPFTKLA